MADQAVGGPLAVDVFGIGGNWIAQNNKNNDVSDRASGLKANGDEAASKMFNGRNEISVPYKCFVETGNLTLPNVGSVSNGYVITQVVLAPAKDNFPTMTVTGHQHDSNAHTALNEYAATLTIPAQFGIPTMFSQSNAACGKVSMSYTLACDHIDETGGTGDHLAGQNLNGRETLALEYIGTPSHTVPAGWDTLNTEDDGDNTKFDTTSCNFHHLLLRS